MDCNAGAEMFAIVSSYSRPKRNGLQNRVNSKDRKEHKRFNFNVFRIQTCEVCDMMKHIDKMIFWFSLIIITGIAMFLTCEYVSAEDMDTELSFEIQEYCFEIGEQYNICPELLIAIIEHESTGNEKAVNDSCKGLMQINVPCHKERMKRLNITDIYDPYSNILVGADLLHELFEKYEDPAVVLMAYNGTKNPVKRAEQGKITKYATSVLERSEQLERVNGK